MRNRIKKQFVFVIIFAVAIGLVAYPQIIPNKGFLSSVKGNLEKLKINLGLDLQGGIHLEYQADVSQIDKSQIDNALEGVQDVIERRVNAFGVSEPLVQIARSGNNYRLVVELAGVKDIDQAKALIKETPYLDFREQVSEEVQEIPQDQLDKQNDTAKATAQSVLEKAKSGQDFSELAKKFSDDPGSKEQGGDLGFAAKGMFVPEFDEVLFNENFLPGEIWPELVETQFGWHIIKKVEERGEGDQKEVRAQHILIAKATQPAPALDFKQTGLSGKHLDGSQVVFDPQTSQPQISLRFNAEGKELFSQITKRNIGKPLAIYLDGAIISAPTVQAEITDGEAVITGSFSLEEAKTLSRRLNEGALPIPIELVSQQSVEASLGNQSLMQSLKAGLIGLLLVIIFMIAYYRFFGLVASIALLIYSGLMVTIFKLSFFSPWQITLTLSGIAGFILSVGMAVDANVLIFERTKEEIQKGRDVKGAVEEGFRRAWPSIRDGNYSTLITSIILITFGTGFVKGFAVTLTVGILVSMFTAIVLVKIILRFLAGDWMDKREWLLMKIKRQKIQP